MTRILVGRPEGRFGALLRDAGFDVLHVELVRTRRCSDLSELGRLLPRINEFQGLIFTSPVAAEVFVDAAGSANRFGGSVYTLGERATGILDRAGYRVVHEPEANTAEELVADLGRAEFDGKRLLFIRGDKSLRAVPELLNVLAEVEEVVVYETEDVLIPADQRDLIRLGMERGEFHWLCFFSPSAVDSFIRHFGTLGSTGPQTAAIGKTTARAAATNGFRVGFVSERANADNFARGLIGHIKKID